MKTPFAAAFALALAGCASMHASEPGRPAPASAAVPSADNKAALAGVSEMKIAFDFTEANPQVLVRKLDVVETTRKQLLEAGVKPRIVLAFRGGASYYTQLDLAAVKEADRADALAVRAKLRAMARADGVESLEQCNLPLSQLKLKPADLMPEVKLVGNGWISLAAYQARGYGYIAP
jgi:intracellular sulfur oxidation DsrE/DsrF family protein